MSRHAKLVAVALGLVVVGMASNAKADLAFCNSYSQTVYVDFYAYYFGSGPCTSELGQNIVSDDVGWYTITPGHCATVITGGLDGYVWQFCGANVNGVVYFADAANGAYWGEGSNYDCITRNSHSYCPIYVCDNGALCNPNGGYDWATSGNMCNYGVGTDEQFFDLGVCGFTITLQ